MKEPCTDTAACASHVGPTVTCTAGICTSTISYSLVRVFDVLERSAFAMTLRYAVVISLLSATSLGCRPASGSSCKARDSDRVVGGVGSSTALVCVDDHWVEKRCRQGLRAHPDPQSGDAVFECQDWLDPEVDEPCYLEPSPHGMPADESACSRDKKATLSCVASVGHSGGGRWKIRKGCPSGTQCVAEGVHCAEAQPGRP